MAVDSLTAFITRKLKRGGYAPVHHEENGIIPNSYQATNSPEKDMELGAPDVVVTNEVEAVNSNFKTKSHFNQL